MGVKQETKYYLGLVDEYDVPNGYDCYVWVGRFCVNGIEWCIRNGKRYEILQEENMTNNDIYSIRLYLDKVRDKVIRHLKEELNQYHKTNYDEFKWRILLNFWVIYFLPSIYDKYLTLEKIKTEDKIFHVNLYKLDCVGIALDQLDFGNLMSDDFGFHKYQYSILLKYISDISNIVVDKWDIYERMPMNICQLELPEHVKNFVDEYRRYKEKTHVQDEIVIQSPYIKFTLYKEIMEKNYGKISGYFLDYVYHVRGTMNIKRNLDIEWRTQECNISEENTDEFVRLIYKIVGYFIPIAYLEEFDNLKTIALDNYKWGENPKVLIFDCEGVTINELFKIYMMNIDVEHVHKVDIMHAIPYGMGGDNWYVFHELQICDEFLNCEGKKIYPLPVNFTQMPFITFFRLPNRKNYESNRIIYANYSYPQHRSRLSLMEWNWQRYMDGELDFFRMLDKNVVSEVEFRIHPYHKTQWNNIERIKEIIPELVFDKVPVFFDSIFNAKLVISETFGAAAMEAIAVGKPTVILYNPIDTYVELNDNYKDIEDMIRVGIIAETPEKLAALVNHIHGNVENWWNEPERQQVVKKIRDKYAYFPENAKEIWVNKVTAYLNNEGKGEST